MLTNNWVKSGLVVAAALLAACGGGSDGLGGRGSIAISESTGKAAFIWDAINQNVANDAARSKCGGGDCKVILQFSQCGALSADANSRTYAVAEAESAVAAQQAADRSCTSKGGQACGAVIGLPAKCT